MSMPKGLVWSQKQCEIAALLQQGLTPIEIEKQGVATYFLAFKVKTAMAKGDTPPSSEETAPDVPTPQEGKPTEELPAAAPAPKKPPAAPKRKAAPAPKDLPTTEVTEATSLKLVPKVVTIPLSISVFSSYMCAVAKGFPSGLAEWLDIACTDFWSGRGVNPFQVISTVTTPQLEEAREVS